VISVKEAKFIKSSRGIDDALPSTASEVVFLGRSNVGKSSLINMIASRQGLAKSSATPGKTRLINFFEIVLHDNKGDYPLRLVDLPGFGYAKVSHSMKDEWQEELTRFLAHRRSIRIYFHLIDSRHPELEIDREVGEFIAQMKTPDQKIIPILTKVDKLGQSEKAKLKKLYPTALMVSSAKTLGAQEVRKMILESVFAGVIEGDA